MASPVKKYSMFRNFIFYDSTWFFWVGFSSIVTTRNLTKFVVLISMLLNIMVGSYHGTKTPFRFMKHNILSSFCSSWKLMSESIHSQVFIYYQLFGKVFLHFYKNKKGFIVLSLLKIIESKYFFTLWRWLTKIRNNNGPKTSI